MTKDSDFAKYIMWLNQSVLIYPRYNLIMINQEKKNLVNRFLL